MEAIKISIVVSIYNNEQHLRECLDSVLNQTLTAIEVICINAVPDGTSSTILKEYAEKDKMFAKIIAEPNKSIGKLQNEAIHLAKGEFVAFLDAGGYYSAGDVLKTLYAAAKESNALIAGGGSNRINDQKYKTDSITHYGAVINCVDYNASFGYRGFIFDSEFLRKNKIFFPPHAYYADYADYADLLFFAKAMIKAKRFYALQEVVHVQSWKKEVRDKHEIKDALKGIRKCLSLTKKHSFANLHYMAASEMETPPCWDAIKKRLKKFDLILAVWFISTQHHINMRLIKKTYPDYVKKLSFIKVSKKVKNIFKRPIKKRIGKIIKKLQIMDSSDRKVLHNLRDQTTSLQDRINHLLNQINDMRQNEKFFIDILYGRFLRSARENTILLIEPNDCHGDGVPSYAKYLLELGYNVDVVMTPIVAATNPMCRFADSRVHSYEVPFSCFCAFFRNRDFMDSYKAIFFASHIRYTKGNYLIDPSIFDLFPDLFAYKDKTFVVEHHLERINQEMLKADRVVMLVDSYKERQIAVNLHYYGEVAITPKNKGETVFCAVGTIDPERRNFNILFEALEQLSVRKTGDFKVVVVGNGKLDNIPEKIRKYFEIKGYLDFSEFYDTVEQADFLLALLDPASPLCEKYRVNGTCGNFHLSPAFGKPLIIHEVFAAKPGFTPDNALVYFANDELADCMEKAISMGQEDYHALQEGLRRLSQSLGQRSREVMERVMRKVEWPDFSKNYFHFMLSELLVRMGYNLNGKTVYEIGADVNLECAEALVKQGAKSVYAANPKIIPNEPPCDGIVIIKDLGENTFIEDEKFDLIYGFALLEHVLFPDKLASEILRLLKKGGSAYLHGWPLWTSQDGNHVYLKTATSFYEFGSGTLFDNWYHLTYPSEADFAKYMQSKNIPSEDIPKIWFDVFENPAQSRFTPAKIIKAFTDIKEFDVDIQRWYTDAEPNDYYFIAKEKFSEDDLKTRGMALFITKRDEVKNKK